MKRMILIFLAMTLPLAGCGKKADVVPPPGYELPRQQSEGK